MNLFTQFGGAELIYENNGIAGVITEDKGIDKNGKPKDNYTPGYELPAKVPSSPKARVARSPSSSSKNTSSTTSIPKSTASA